MAKGLRGVGGVVLKPQNIQLVGDQFSLPENDLVEAEAQVIDGDRHIHMRHFRE